MQTRTAFSSYGEAVFLCAIAMSHSSKSAPLHDRVDQRSDPVDRDPDESPDFRLKSSGGTIPVPVNRTTPFGKAVIPAEPVDQVLEAAGHAGNAGFALENRAAIAFDLHADADRPDGEAWPPPA